MECPICNEGEAILVSDQSFTEADISDGDSLCHDSEEGKVAVHDKYD